MGVSGWPQSSALSWADILCLKDLDKTSRVWWSSLEFYYKTVKTLSSVLYTPTRLYCRFPKVKSEAETHLLLLRLLLLWRVRWLSPQHLLTLFSPDKKSCEKAAEFNHLTTSVTALPRSGARWGETEEGWGALCCRRVKWTSQEVTWVQWNQKSKPCFCCSEAQQGYWVSNTHYSWLRAISFLEKSELIRSTALRRHYGKFCIAKTQNPTKSFCLATSTNILVHYK